MKGNAVDLAMAVIVGAACGKIVASLVGDVSVPPLGLLIGGVNFSDMAVKLDIDPKGAPVWLKYGAFVQTVFDFLIFAIVISIVIRQINKLEKPPAAAAAAIPPRQEYCSNGFGTR